MSRCLFCSAFVCQLFLSCFYSHPCQAASSKESVVAEQVQEFSKTFDSVAQDLAGETPDLLKIFNKIDEVADGVDSFWFLVGKSLNDFPEHVVIENQAKRILTMLLELKKTKANEFGYVSQDAFDLSEISLLGLAGRVDEALAKVMDVHPGGGCGNWISTVYFDAHLRGAVILERAGRYSEAAEMQGKALEHNSLVLGNVKRDRIFAHYGYLLVRSGKTKQGIKEYQRVMKEYPGTEGASHAREMIEQLGKVVGLSDAED